MWTGRDWQKLAETTQKLLKLLKKKLEDDGIKTKVRCDERLRLVEKLKTSELKPVRTQP